MMDHEAADAMGANGTSMANPFCMGAGRVMLPGFQLATEGAPCVLFLFQGAVVNTAVRYGFAIFGTFLIAFAVEILRWLRAHTNKREFAVVGDIGETPLDICLFFLYVAQMCLAYWLMLLVMLYEYAFFIAIIAGLGFGLVASRRLDRAFFPYSLSDDAHGTPCCDSGYFHSDKAKPAIENTKLAAV